MLRAPIWITSAISTTASTSRGSISSVTSGSPVSSRASARIVSASTPSPWNAYGEVRGLKAPPRSIVTPSACDGARRLERLLARLDRARPGDEAEVMRRRAAVPRASITVGSRRSSRETSLYGFRIGSTCSTPGKPSSGSVASSSRSPIAPITVASRPWLTCALAPASSSRATTSSTCSEDACAPITIRSSGEPTAATRLSVVAPLRLEAGRNGAQMRIFSGIQPTGDKHLGNLIGGFRQYAATQEQGEGFFCIVDLHSITVEYDPDDFREKTLDLAAMLFATGLDPERSTVFVQSHVPAHAEAAWLLGSVTSFGQLRRMTQFKEKADQREFVSSGALHLPGADGRRHPALPDRHRPDRRRPAPAPRARPATSPSASTPASARRSRCPRASTPRSARGSWTCRSRTKKMSTTGGHPAGHGEAPRRPRHDPEEVPLRRHRLRARRCAAARTSRASRT